MRWTGFLFTLLLLLAAVHAAGNPTRNRNGLTDPSRAPPANSQPTFIAKAIKAMVIGLVIMMVLMAIFGVVLPMPPSSSSPAARPHSPYDGECRVMEQANGTPIPINTLRAQDHSFAVNAFIECTRGNQERQVFEAYNFLQKSGTQGNIVFSAKDQAKQEKVVKVSTKTTPDSKNEPKAAKALRRHPHPNLIIPESFYEHGDEHVISISEKVRGISVGQLGLIKKRLDEDKVAWIMRETLKALKHLHLEAGVVHSDLHIGNIMIDRTGSVKIIDFGQAKLLHEIDPSPNQLGSVPHGPAADLFHLGRTALFLLGHQELDFESWPTMLNSLGLPERLRRLLRVCAEYSPWMASKQKGRNALDDTQAADFILYYLDELYPQLNDQRAILAQTIQGILANYGE